MKILLIYPRPEPSRYRRLRAEPSWMPLGLAFLAAALRKAGHRVEIFDRYACQSGNGMEKAEINAAMTERVRRFKPDLIGFNTVSPLIHDTAECAALLRPGFRGLLMAGGHHATALPEITLRKIPQLDLVLSGEGEEALPMIADGVSPEKIPGVALRGEDGKIFHTPHRQVVDLDHLPFPSLDLMDMGFYLSPGTQAIRGHYLSTVSVLTSRGCLNRCDFCSESLTYGRGIRYHSPDYVLAWVQRLLKDYRFEAVYFHDNDFLSNEERAGTIFERFIQTGLNRKLKFALQTRADRCHRAMARLMKRAGCVLVEIGVEASSQEYLDLCHKGTTVAMNESAIAQCRAEGLAVHAYMLTALPGETLQDLEQKQRWIKKVRPDTFSWHHLSLYPGTRLYREKGNAFFERIKWKENEVKAFYRFDPFSKIPPETRRRWMKRRFEPFQRLRIRTAILRQNSPLKVLRLAGDRVRGVLIAWLRRDRIFGSGKIRNRIQNLWIYRTGD